MKFQELQEVCQIFFWLMANAKQLIRPDTFNNDQRESKTTSKKR